MCVCMYVGTYGGLYLSGLGVLEYSSQVLLSMYVRFGACVHLLLVFSWLLQHQMHSAHLF